MPYYGMYCDQELTNELRIWIFDINKKLLLTTIYMLSMKAIQVTYCDCYRCRQASRWGNGTKQKCKTTLQLEMFRFVLPRQSSV